VEIPITRHWTKFNFIYHTNVFLSIAKIVFDTLCGLDNNIRVIKRIAQILNKFRDYMECVILKIFDY